jgi:hypothetical protein
MFQWERRGLEEEEEEEEEEEAVNIWKHIPKCMSIHSKADVTPTSGKKSTLCCKTYGNREIIL